ncbi:hypothetical protein [Gluconobacter potus]|uniref:hypothetical protein n=1 Tax=Gluconobacter potus TaxID=2724927 RepID=UPI000ABB719F
MSDLDNPPDDITSKARASKNALFFSRSDPVRLFPSVWTDMSFARKVKSSLKLQFRICLIQFRECIAGCTFLCEFADGHTRRASPFHKGVPLSGKLTCHRKQPFMLKGIQYHLKGLSRYDLFLMVGSNLSFNPA